MIERSPELAALSFPSDNPKGRNILAERTPLVS